MGPMNDVRSLARRHQRVEAGKQIGVDCNWRPSQKKLPLLRRRRDLTGRYRRISLAGVSRHTTRIVGAVKNHPPGQKLAICDVHATE